MTKTIVSIDVVDAEKRRVPSKHYVYVINVKWSDGSSMVVYRRYSRFFDLQTQLLDKFPIEGGCTDPACRIIPFLPGKIFFGRSHIRDVAMKRLGEIDAYCKGLLNLPPHISQCDDVLEFFEVETDDLDPPKEEPNERRFSLGSFGILMDQISKTCTEMKRKLSKKLSGSKLRTNGEKKAEKISGPKQLEQYTVIADYDAQEKGEINLQAGVTVEVVEKSESGWWFVHADEQQGWVPSTYLHPAQGSSVSQSAAPCAKDGAGEKFICIERYEAMNPDEVDLEKGVVVEVLQKNMDGWWLVRYQGQEGMAPATYLRKSNDPYAINLVEKSRKSGVQIISSLSAISNIMATTNSPRNSGVFTDSPRNSMAGVPGVDDSDVTSRDGGDEEAEVGDDEWDDEDLTRDMGPKGDSYTKVMFKQKSLERGGSLKPPPRQSSITQIKVPPPPPPSAKPSTMYITVAQFEDTVGDGISFGIGETVKVLEKTSTGWWFVQRGEEEGWVPESYLEPAESSHAETNGESAPKPTPPKPPEKKVAKPPSLPSKPVEPSKPSASSGDDADDAARGSQVSGLASALKSKFETKGAGMPSKPANRPGPPPPPPKHPSPAGESETDGAPVSGGGVAGLANALKSKFEASQQHSDKPSVPTSKPAPPAKTAGAGAAQNRPAPPQKPGAVPPKPGVSQKPSLPFKKPAVNDAGSSENTSQGSGRPKFSPPKPAGGASKPSSGPPKLPSGPPGKLPSGPPGKLPSGPPGKLPSGPPKLPSGPPKLPSGPPKLPSKPPGPKASSGPSAKSGVDIPSSTNKVSNMAAAFSGLGLGQNPPSSDSSGSRPTLPGKKPQAPTKKPVMEGLEGGSNKPRVGNLVSELSGKLQFGGEGGGGPKIKSPEPSPVTKTGPWSGQAADDTARPVAVFPGMAGVAKPPGPAISSKPQPPAPPSNTGKTSSVQYEVIADFAAGDAGEVNLVCGDVVEVLDKQDDWWLVNSNGAEGWAPANYLQPVSNGRSTGAPRPGWGGGGEETVVYRAICDFTPQSDEELGFYEGQEVSVVEETDTGWWKIELDGQQGWAPADYITMDTW